MSVKTSFLPFGIALLMAIAGIGACNYPSDTNTGALNAPPQASPTVRPSPATATRADPVTQATGQAAAAADSPAKIPACSSDVDEPLFNTIPIDPDDFLALRPLGFLSPPIHIFPAKHSAFSMTLPGQKPVARPVRAPGRIWVKEIWEASFSTGGANYQMFVYPCHEVRVYFGHIASLSERLAAQLEKSKPNCNSFADGTATVTTCRHVNLSLQLEAGDVLGTGPDTAGVDFGIVDFRRPPAAFVAPEHYDRYYPYYFSPLDYFDAERRSILERKSGDVFGNKSRVSEPLGGSHMQDIAGTAQGNWFSPGKYHRKTSDLSSALALVHDYLDRRQPIAAIGTSVTGLQMGLYSFKVEKEGLINRDFSQVRPDGKEYCYDGFLEGRSEGGIPLRKPSGALLLDMPSETGLRLEFVPQGSCQTLSNRTLTANATTFER